MDYLIVLQLCGNTNPTLKGKKIIKTIQAEDMDEAMDNATRGKVFANEGYQIVCALQLP